MKQGWGFGLAMNCRQPSPSSSPSPLTSSDPRSLPPPKKSHQRRKPHLLLQRRGPRPLRLVLLHPRLEAPGALWRVRLKLDDLAGARGGKRRRAGAGVLKDDHTGALFGVAWIRRVGGWVRVQLQKLSQNLQKAEPRQKSDERASAPLCCAAQPATRRRSTRRRPPRHSPPTPGASPSQTRRACAGAAAVHPALAVAAGRPL